MARSYLFANIFCNVSEHLGEFTVREEERVNPPPVEEFLVREGDALLPVTEDEEVDVAPRRSAPFRFAAEEDKRVA